MPVFPKKKRGKKTDSENEREKGGKEHSWKGFFGRGERERQKVKGTAAVLYGKIKIPAQKGTLHRLSFALESGCPTLPLPTQREVSFVSFLEDLLQ